MVEFLSSKEIVAVATSGTLIALAIQALRWLWPKIAGLGASGSHFLRTVLRKQLLKEAARNRKFTRYPNPVAAILARHLFLFLVGCSLFFGGVGYGLLNYATIDAIGPTKILDELGYVLSVSWFFLGVFSIFQSIDKSYRSFEWFADPSKARRETLEELRKYKD